MLLTRRFTTALLAISGLLAAPGCESEGGLAIRLSLPEAEELSPATGGMIAEITLEARAADGQVSRLTRSIEDTSSGVDLGRLEPSEAVEVSVELRSLGGQLLGFGRAATPVEVDVGSDVEVELNVRRPLAYLPNQDGVLFAVDASRDLANSVAPGISVAGTPHATACSADGGDLFVALASGGTSAISLISTSTHLPSREISSGLRPAPSDLLISPDGRYAALAHKTTTSGTVGGVSVVDLNSGTTSFVELGSVSRLAIDATGELYALAQRSPTCLSPSRTGVIYRMSLGDIESGTQVPFSGSASDIAVNPVTGELLVADPCAGEVASVGAAQTVFYTLVGAGALATTDDSILIGGVGVDASISIVTVGGDGELMNSVDLPPAVESTESEDLGNEGQSVRVVADADSASILDLAVVPGGGSFAVLTQSFFDIERSGNLPPMTLNTWEYLLVDESSEAAVQRIRTRCELNVDPEPPFDLENWRCGSAPDQIALAPEFQLESISVLYGAR